MADKLESMMRKIQAMLARADHPNTPPAEADTARSMAERLMKQYRIEESQLIAEQGASAFIKPVVRKVPLYPMDAKYRNVYNAIFAYVLDHVGARGVYRAEYDEDQNLMYVGQVVGYEADVRYLELLYQEARSLFASRMEPKPRPDLSDEDNVYALRNAGIERIKIAALMGWGTTGSATAKVTRLYKAACKARDEEPVLTGRGNLMGAYRDEYESYFLNELWTRLYKARDGAGAISGELVLASRKENVNEAFYDLYPHLRPDPNPTPVSTKPAKVKDYKWTAADERRWQRSQSKAGQAGKAAGMRAAGEVNIKPEVTKPGHLDN